MKPQVAKTETSNRRQDEHLEDLRAFCLVVDHASITAAAKALGETKGTVSRRLTRLEQSLGVLLVRRSPRHVQATEDGLLYREAVGRGMDILDDARSAVQQSRTTPSGHIRVTAPFDLGVSVLAPIVADFLARYPDITIDMLLTEAVLDFDAHQIDIAVRAAERLRDSSLVAHRLHGVESALYASPAYLEAHGTPRKLSDLQAHRLLMLRAMRTTSLAFRNASGEREVAPVRVVVSCSDHAFAHALALANGGIALLPSIVAEPDVRANRLVRVLPKYAEDRSAQLYIVHQSSRALPSRVRVFKEAMIQGFEKKCAIKHGKKASKMPSE